MSLLLCLLAYSVVALTVGRRMLVRRSQRGSSPWLTVLAWQVVSLSVPGAWLLAGALLAVAAVAPPVARLLAHCGSMLHSGLDGAPALAWIGLVVASAVVARVAASAVAVGRAARGRRRRHRAALSLIADTDAELGALLVDADEPLAYCVPGGTGGGRIVLTSAARRVLTDRQLRAVLAHERTHLAERHHLAIAVADALARALPRLRLFADCATYTARLLEMRADDEAARRWGPVPVATALAALSSRPAPAAALGAAGATAVARVERLMSGPGGAERRRDRAVLLGMMLSVAAVPVLCAALPFCPGA